MALTKTIIAEKIQDTLELSRTETYDVMEDFLEIMKKTIANGEDIMISGFGKFCVNEKSARKGRNPAKKCQKRSEPCNRQRNDITCQKGCNI